MHAHRPSGTAAAQEPRPLCLYHQGCLDGKAAAAVVRAFEPRAECVAWNYGQPMPDATGRRVYVVDLAPSAALLRALHHQASELYWYDHHHTAVAIQRELGFGVVDESECGATLTWRMLFGDQPLPTVLAHVRDRDLWQWKLADSRAVVAGLSERFAGDDLDGLLSVNLEEMATLGRPLVAAQHRRVRLALRRAVGVRDPYGLLGLRALVVNMMTDLSEIGDQACASPADGGLGYDLCICFSLRNDGRWVHNLRSRGVDCERIARHRGGGGHLRAASYIADQPFPLSDDCLEWPV